MGDCFAGGCLCGALRYRAGGPPTLAGYCCCADCRKASGSGFIGFMAVPAERLVIEGESRVHAHPTGRGGLAHRNFCPSCGGLVFGGERGVSKSHTLYAGSLDDPALFHPTLAIFAVGRPAWVILPQGVTAYAGMPGG